MAFVVALKTGVIHKSIFKCLPFCSTVEYDQTTGVNFKWPPCYALHIMTRFTQFPRARPVLFELTDLQSKLRVVGDGMAWERLTAVAILLQCILATCNGEPGPLGLCDGGAARGFDVMHCPLGNGVSVPGTSLKDKDVYTAAHIIARHSQLISAPALVLSVPTVATFVTFDGFVALMRPKEVVTVCAYQCRSRWINGYGHLLHSAAPNKTKISGPNANRWVYYNAQETDELLGKSISVLR